MSPASSDEIEGRDRPGLAVAELPGRRLEPDLDHPRHELEFIEQIEGRRMEGRAAKLHDELWLGGEQHGRDAAAAERQRGGQADRAGADDDNAVVFRRHRGRTFRGRADIAKWPAEISNRSTAMRDVLGWRRKFGVLGPSTNTIVQPDFEMMRPPGVTNHYSRIFTPNAQAVSNDTFMAGTQVIGENTLEAVRRS